MSSKMMRKSTAVAVALVVALVAMISFVVAFNANKTSAFAGGINPTLKITKSENIRMFISSKNKHSKTGAIIQFDVVETFAGATKYEMGLFAGLSSPLETLKANNELYGESFVKFDSDSKGVYVPYESAGVKNVVYDNTLCGSANDKGTWFGFPFSLGNTYKAVYDYANKKFTLLKKGTSTKETFVKIYEFTGLVDSGAGHAGIISIGCKGIIDNFIVSDLDNTVVCDEKFDNKINNYEPNEKNLVYSDNTILAANENDNTVEVSTVATGGDKEYIPIADNYLLNLTGNDKTKMFVSSASSHNEKGVKLEFDVLNSASSYNTDLGKCKISFFAGQEKDINTDDGLNELFGDSLFEFQLDSMAKYKPRESNASLDVKFNMDLITAAGGGAGEAYWVWYGMPFSSGNRYQVEYNFEQTAFRVYEKVIGAEKFTLIFEVNGIKKGGAGYAGVIFEQTGLKIDNFSVLDVDGYVLNETSFDGKVEYVKDSRYTNYCGNALLSVFENNAPMDITQYIKAGRGDSIGNKITLSKSIDKVENGGALNVYSYITSIVDISDGINATNGFDVLDGLNINYYKDNIKVTGITNAGNYVIEYVFNDAIGNKSFARVYLQSVVKEIDTITINGDVKTTYYIGEVLDVTNLTLTVAYTIGSNQTIPVTQAMIALDTSVKGSTVLKIVYEGKELSMNVNVVEQTFIVSGTVKCGNDIIKGATIKYGDKTLTTDADGKFSITVVKGTNLSYKVIAEGYEEVTKTLNNIEENKNIEINLTKIIIDDGKKEPIEKKGCADKATAMAPIMLGIMIALACLFIKKR